MDYILEPELYQKVFYGIILVLCIIAGSSRLGMSNSALISGSRNHIYQAWILFFAVTLFIGLRPPVETFGDTIGYVRAFLTQSFSRKISNGEWFWASINQTVYRAGGGWAMCSLIIACFYVGGVFMACRRWFKDNVYVAMLFVMGLFSFFSFGVNTIRNGVALSLVMAGMSVCLDSPMNKIRIKPLCIALILFLLALSTHKTAALPASCFLVSLFFLKDIKISLCVWVAMLIFSLMFGNIAVTYIEEFGFDDRLDRYIDAGRNARAMAKGFSHTGFRWDFLLYGIMPILMGWFVIVKKRVRDRTYIVLTNTYILANAFWLLAIRAAHTDRFAYLSWFIYGIILAYPLLRLNVFKNQPKALFIILMGCIFSTWAFLVMWSLR